MALTSIPSAPATQRPTLEALAAAVRELQRQRVAVVAGAAAATNIAVTGIATDDVVRSALYFPITGGNVTSARDITAEIEISSAGNIRVRTTVTTGGVIVLTYIDVA